MIAVTNVDTINTHDRDKYVPLQRCLPFDPVGVYFDPDARLNITVTEEMIKGRKFVNTQGIPVILGWDEQTQEVLGLPFEVFDKLEKRRVSDYEENTRLRKENRELKEMSIWRFIKNKYFR